MFFQIAPCFRSIGPEILNLTSRCQRLCWGTCPPRSTRTKQFPEFRQTSPVALASRVAILFCFCAGRPWSLERATQTEGGAAAHGVSWTHTVSSGSVCCRSLALILHVLLFLAFLIFNFLLHLSLPRSPFSCSRVYTPSDLVSVSTPCSGLRGSR